MRPLSTATAPRLITSAMAKLAVFIHGMWGTPDVWRNWRTFLEARGWQTLAPALRHPDRHPRPARLPGRSRTVFARLAGEAGRDRPFDGRADRAAAVRARPGPRRRAAHTRAAGERARDPAIARCG